MFVSLCSFFFFFKQKTAYEMRISDWSSDVCSSDLHQVLEQVREAAAACRLVLAAHAVPDVDRHDRRLVVLVHDHRKAVGLGELLVRDGDLCRIAAGVSEPPHGRAAAADGGRPGPDTDWWAGVAAGGKGHGNTSAGMN